jgi:hypothetical protein
MTHIILYESYIYKSYYMSHIEQNPLLQENKLILKKRIGPTEFMKITAKKITRKFDGNCT